MGELTLNLGKEILALKRESKIVGTTKPFQQEIYLLNCQLAGCNYYDPEDTHKTIQVDEELILKREPWNQYDTFAIAVLNKEKKKIGYIPRDNNKVFARLLDAGKFVTAYVNQNKWDKEAVTVNLRLVLKEL